MRDKPKTVVMTPTQVWAALELAEKMAVDIRKHRKDISDASGLLVSNAVVDNKPHSP